MLRHVLVCLKSAPENRACRDAAIDLGRQTGAFLTGLYVRSLPPVPTPLAYPLTGFVIGEPIALSPHMLQEVGDRQMEHDAHEDDRQTEVFAEFLGSARTAGVRADTLVRLGDVEQGVLDAARATDLVMLGRGRKTDMSLLGSVAGSIVRSVERPVLIVPERRALRTIAVAYDGSPGADRALAMAADLALHWREAAPRVVLIGVTRRGPDSLRFLEPARRYLNVCDLPHTVRAGSGEAEWLIDGLAFQENADLLCIGAYRHSLARDVLLGSTTQAILERWDRPILLCH